MHKPNYDFNKDLVVANKTERQIAKYLESMDIKTLEMRNDNKYDLLVEMPSKKQVTIEIKEDFSCQRTGNVGVEYECRGKPSGISVSQAGFYLYKVHEPSGEKRLYIIQTENLKKMIKEHKWFREVCGGDPGSNSRNYLFKLDVIKENFKCVGKLDY